MRPECGFQMAANWPYIRKKIIKSQFADMTSSLSLLLLLLFFWLSVLFLSSLIIGPSFMSISWLVLELWQFFIYIGLTRNPEIGNTPVWILHDIWRLGRVSTTKFGTYVSNKMLLNTAKCQGYSFYCFWVIKWKPTGGLEIPPPHPD